MSLFRKDFPNKDVKCYITYQGEKNKALKQLSLKYDKIRSIEGRNVSFSGSLFWVMGRN